MKKTISALVAVTVLSFGAAFAQEPAKAAQSTEQKTTTNPVTGSTTETKT